MKIGITSRNRQRHRRFSECLFLRLFREINEFCTCFHNILMFCAKRVKKEKHFFRINHEFYFLFKLPHNDQLPWCMRSATILEPSSFVGRRFKCPTFPQCMLAFHLIRLCWHSCCLHIGNLILIANVKKLIYSRSIPARRSFAVLSFLLFTVFIYSTSSKLVSRDQEYVEWLRT